MQKEIALNGLHHPDTLHGQLNQVEVLVGSGQPAEAVSEVDRLEPVFTSILGPDHKLTLDLRENRAEALSKLARYDDAVAAPALRHAGAYIYLHQWAQRLAEGGTATRRPMIRPTIAAQVSSP